MSQSVRLRRLSRMMQFAVLAFACFIGFGALWFLTSWIGDAREFETAIRQAYSLQGPLAFTPPAVAVTAVLVSLQFGLVFLALYCVWQMFGAFGGEEPLSVEAATWMHRASIAFVLTVAGSIVLQVMIVLALTLGNPAGQKALSVSFGSSQGMALLIAAIMYMTGRVLAVAAEVRAEQRDFV